MVCTTITVLIGGFRYNPSGAGSMSTLKYVESRLMKPGNATPMIGMMKKHAPMISKTPVVFTWVPLVTHSVLYHSWTTSA